MSEAIERANREAAALIVEAAIPWPTDDVYRVIAKAYEKGHRDGFKAGWDAKAEAREQLDRELHRITGGDAA